VNLQKTRIGEFNVISCFFFGTVICVIYDGCINDSHVTSKLVNATYVCDIAIDFSQAFDTVNLFSVLNKMSSIAISDKAYHRILCFFHNRSHHSVNSCSHSVNDDIAIQWEWSNFDHS